MSPGPTWALPTVFLPGASGRSSVWEPVARRLASRGLGVSVDYPGFGGARAFPGVRSLDDLHRYVVDRLRPRFDVVGLSMGCVLALRLALEVPDRIGRVVLVALTGGVDVVALGGEDWRPWYRKERSDCPPWFVDDRSDFTARLATVRAPVQLLFGDGDPLSPVAVGEFLRDRLAHARLTVLPGATHSLTEEEPDAVAAVIREHLDGA